MEIVLIFLSLVTIIFAYFQFIVPFAKGEVRFVGKFPFVIKVKEDIEGKKEDFSSSYSNEVFPKLSIPQKILSYIWYYPLAGGNKASWSVKESQTVLGNLVAAAERPGLGIAVFSVELGSRIFGDLAKSRIENCISWWLMKTQKRPPHLIEESLTDPITSKVEIRADFRHTLALGTIMSRAKSHPKHVNHYIEYCLSLQRDDGGWSPGYGADENDLSTVLYAVELLALNVGNADLPEKTNDKLTRSIQNAISWFVTNCGEGGLWESGILKEHPWEPLATTSWVLRRLTALGFDVREHTQWRRTVANSTMSLLEGVAHPLIWVRSDQLHKFRVEARVASAVQTAIKFNYLESILLERSLSYIADWKNRANRIIASIAFNEFDLGTALFLSDTLVKESEFDKLRGEVLDLESEFRAGAVQRRSHAKTKSQAGR